MMWEMAISAFHREKIIHELKKKSQYYPHLTFDSISINNEILISTLVRIKRNDTWYVVHCLETVYLSGSFERHYAVEFAINRLLHTVCTMQYFWRIDEHNDTLQTIDTLQISEEERLTLLRR